MKLCKCGCGNLITNNKNEFINNHQNINRKVSKETRKKISNTLKNHIVSKETREKISDILKRKFKSKEIKSSVMSPQGRKRTSNRMKKNNPMFKREIIQKMSKTKYKGLGYGIGWNKIKRIIKSRDDYTCQKCRSKDKIITHHIDGNKKNNDFNNLITLCRSCHYDIHYRKEYKNFFKKKDK